MKSLHSKKSNIDLNNETFVTSIRLTVREDRALKLISKNRMAAIRWLLLKFEESSVLQKKLRREKNV